MADTEAFLDYLAGQPDVKPGRVGTTGYCMGGLMSLTAAGTYPDRIIATASYHGHPMRRTVPICWRPRSNHGSTLRGRLKMLRFPRI
jgi:carboxymethylenebutenolidase